MKHLNFLTLWGTSPDNGPTMDRHCIGISPIKSQKFFTILLVLLLGFGNVWGAEQTITLNFYDESTLSSSSGTDVTVAYARTNTTCSDESLTDMTKVITAASKTGNVRYGMNGGVSFGANNANAASWTITFDSGFEFYKVEIVGAHYETNNFTINGDAAKSGSLNAKGTKLKDCTNTLLWEPNEGDEYSGALVFAKTATKRGTIYTIKLYYDDGEDDTPSYNVTATRNDNAYGSVSVSGTTITATPADCYQVASGASGYTVTSGTATVSHTSNSNTLTVTPSSDCTVQVNFEKKTVNTYVDEIQGNDDIEACETHDAPSLDDKTPATSGTCAQQHWHFMGWVTEANKATPTDLNIIAPGTEMTASGATYYAVWAKGVAGSSFDGTTEGDYLIYANVGGTNYYATNTVNSSNTLTTTTSAASAQVFTFTKTGSNWYITYTSGNNTYYLTAPNSNSGNMSAFSTTACDWKIAVDGTYGSWHIYSRSPNGNGNNTYSYRGLIYRTSASGFKNYTTGNLDGSDYYDCEIGSPAVYSDYKAVCCTELGQINGSVSWTNSTTAVLTWNDMSNVAASNPYAVSFKKGSGEYGISGVGSISKNAQNKQTCTVTVDEAGAEYTFKLAITGDATHCPKDTTMTATSPKITAPASVSGLGYNAGNGPSAPVSFKVSGSALTGNLTVSTPENSNFKVCATSDGTFGSSIELTPTSGTLAETDVYVQMVEDLGADDYDDEITISGGSATDVIVAVSGTVDACKPLVAPTINGTVTVGLNTATIAWNAVTEDGNGDPIAEGGLLGYVVNITQGSTQVNTKDDVTDETSYELSSLAVNTTYHYAIMAMGDNGYCAENNPLLEGNFTTEDYPTVKLYYSENGALSEGIDQKILTDITLPTEAAECSKTFVGWTTAANASYSHASTAPEPLYAPGKTDFQIPTNANCTLYAVYADVVEASLTYDLVTSVAANDVVVFGINPAYTTNPLKTAGALSNNILGTTSSTYNSDKSKITSLATGTQEFTIGGNSTDGWTVKVGDQYLAMMTDNKNKLQLQEDAYTWAISFDGNIAKILRTGHSYTDNKQQKSGDFTIQYNYNQGGFDRFSGYASDMVGISLYKKNEVAASTTNYSTTCQGKVAKPEITGVTGSTTYESNQTVTITSATDGATIKYTTDGSDPTNSATTMASGSSFTLSTDGTYNIRAIAVKADMTNSDEATAVTNVKIDIPYTSIEDLIKANLAENTSKKLTFTSESNAIITAVNSTNRYIQDASGYGIVIRSSSWDANAIQGKKITGTITGQWKVYEGQMQLDNSTFANMAFTTVDELPTATTVTAIDATNFASHPTALVKLESVTFASEEFSSRNVTINKGNASYTLRDGVYVFGHMVNSNYVQDYDLPLSSTTCDVTGLLIRYTKNENTTYQLVPVKLDGIDTKGADAILPTFDAGGTALEPTQVATGKNISFTLATGYDAVYKVNDGAETAITNNTVVTISNTENATKLYVKASRDFYDDSEVTYYYIANPALVDYSITCATGLTGGNVSADKASATPGTKITLTATASTNYHFGSWSVNSGAITVDANNQFDMPAANVAVSATFIENNKYTIAFTADDADSGDVPTVDAKHANTNFEVPGKGNLVKAGYKFAGWKVGNVVYHQGDEFTTPEEVPAVVPTTITFVAQWVEGSEFTWDATAQGYSNGADLGTECTSPVTIVFAKGTNQNGPKYYTSDNTARFYTGGTLTITAPANKLISEITFNSNINVTANVGSYASATWSGLASEIIFTAGASCSLQTITVTYINGTVTTLSIANVVMKKTDDPKDLVVTCNVQDPTPEISYVIEEADQQYASIAAGKVTALKVTPSPITVTANIAQGSNYTAVSTTFTITVTDKVHPNLSFDEEGYEADLNTAFDAPTLNKPNDITEANISYSSSETSVADVDASTGTITINAEGETTITATFSGDDKYDPQTVTYVLTVIDHTKDVLTASAINVTGSYTDWEDVTVTSGVKFAGNSTTGSGDNTGTIQLRAGDNSGIVTTSNIGYLKSLSATAGSNADGHYLEIYGKTTPYTSAADLYDNTKCGIKIGTIGQNGGDIVWETGKAYTDKYWYIGIKSKTGAAYYSDITFEWEPATLVTYNVTYSAGEGAEGETVELHNIPAGAYTLAAKPADFEKTDKIFAGWKANGTGDILAAGSNYTLSANVEFVAYWSDTYTITYSAGEGADGEAVEIQNIPEGPYTLADKPNDFDKFGFTFAGWKANGEGETLEAGDSYTVSGDVNFIAQWDALPVWVTTYSSNLTVGAEEYTITIKGKNYEGQRYGTTNAVGVATIALRAGAERLHFHAAGWNDESVTITATMNSGATDLGSFGTLVREPNVSGGGKTYTIATPNSEYYSIDLSSYTIEEGAEITFTATAGKRFVLFGVNQEGGNVPVLDHLAFTGEATKFNYEAGDVFDPAGLGVNAIYTIGGVEQEPEAVAANQIEWSFDPAVLALETTEVSVTASYGGKSVSTTIEDVVVVEPVPVITVSPASVNFGIVMQNSSVSARNITVTLKHIEAVTVTVNGSNVDAFDVQDNIASEGTISVVPTSTSTVGHFTATIKVKDNASETSKTISLTLDVEAPDDVRGSWTRVTNANDLEDGMKIVIAEHTESATAHIKAMGRDKGNNRYAIESDLESSVLTPGEGASYFTLEALENNKFAIKTTGGKYLYAAGNGNSNHLKEKAELDNYGNWTISIANGKATILAQGDNANKLMRYNSTGDGLFSCYSDDTKQSPIAIYAKNVKITESGAADVPAGNDVEIGENVTWTVTSDKEVGDLHMKDGAIIANSAKVEANDLYFKAKAGKSNQIFDLSKITVVRDMYYDFQLCDDDVDADYWYSISVPFDVDLNSGVFQVGGTTPLVNHTDFEVWEYDTQKRADTQSNGWKRSSDNMMHAGKAYLIGFNPGQPNIIRLKAAANWKEHLFSGTSMSVVSTGGSGDHDNWNGLANPTGRYIDVNANAQVFNNNTHQFDPFTYDAQAYNFVVGTAFFVQTASAVTISNTDHGQYRAPKHVDDTKCAYAVRITRDEAANFDNQLIVRASEEATGQYTQGHDMLTMNNATSNTAAMLWTENYGGKRLAIEEAAWLNDQATYVLKMFAPKAGTYSISVAEAKANADLYLTYEGSIIWNLSESEYSMDLNKGTTNGYGLMLVKKAPSVVTGVENGEMLNGANGVQKVIIDEHVYILRGGQMYDVNGKMVK